MGEHSDVSNDKRKLDDRHPGEISLVNLSNKELNDFIDYMTMAYKGNYLDYLYSIIGPDKIMLYLETLEGLHNRIPPKKTIVKILFYIKVYNYLESRDFTEESYKLAAKIYGKRVFDLKRIVNKVKNVLERYDRE